MRIEVQHGYDQWMNELENYSYRSDRFLDEWNNGMSLERVKQWMKAAYEKGREHRDHLDIPILENEETWAKRVLDEWAQRVIDEKNRG
jgi:hypothetical protein